MRSPKAGDTMSRKSSIARLQPEIRSYIEGKLAEGRLTFDELIDDVKARFPEQDKAGGLPSWSAMQRYSQKLERRLSAIRASTDAAKMICAQTGDNEDTRSEALTSLIQTALFEAILNLKELDDPSVDEGDRVGILSKVAKNIATLTRSSVLLKKFQETIRERAKIAAADSERIVKKAGLSDELAAELRLKILGITN